jgi:hypothetical protein
MRNGEPQDDEACHGQHQNYCRAAIAPPKMQTRDGSEWKEQEQGVLDGIPERCQMVAIDRSDIDWIGEWIPEVKPVPDEVHGPQRTEREPKADSDVPSKLEIDKEQQQGSSKKQGKSDTLWARKTLAKQESPNQKPRADGPDERQRAIHAVALSATKKAKTVVPKPAST